MKPVSKTAFYCCGVRMTDAESKHPICGDTYAKRFMSPEALAIYAPLKVNKRGIRGNAARHRLIDDYLRDCLGREPQRLIVTVGAGFDSRPYRIPLGRWLELDEAPLVELKDQLLPVAECKNPLTRIAIDFARESLADKLAPFQTGEPCSFVFEGVFMYLEEAEIRRTLDVVRRLFPRHELICDLMRRQFLNKHGGEVRDRIEQLGARLHVVEEPVQLIASSGYEQKASFSVVGTQLQKDLPSWLLPLVRLLPRSLTEGYTVGIFQSSLAT